MLASLACERARGSESASEARALLEGALAGGRLLDEQQLDIVGPYYDLVLGLIAANAFDVAEASLEQALANARARESIPSVAYLTNRRGWMYLRRGSIDRAEADARTGLELLSSHAIPLGIPFAVALLMEALIEGGDTDGAERALHDYGLPDEIEPGPTTNFLLRSRALLHMAQGRPEQGVEDMLEFGRRDELWGGASPLASRWRSHTAVALIAAGETSRRAGSRRRTSSEPGAGACRAVSGRRCGRSRSPRAGRASSSGCARRRPCTSAPQPGSNTPARSPSLVAHCGARTAAPRPAAS